MSFPIKKLIAMVLLIIYLLLVIIIVPIPAYIGLDELDDPVYINSDQWKFVVVKEGEYSPTFNIEKYGTIHIVSRPGTEAYLETKFNVSPTGSIFSYCCESNVYQYVILIDSKGVQHRLSKIVSKDNIHRWDGSRKLPLIKFDISQFKGQSVTIRLQPATLPIGKNPKINYYSFYALAKIEAKGYTFYDYFLLFLKVIGTIIVFSLIVGFIMGYSGSSIFVKISTKFHILVKENYSNLFSNKDKWYIEKWYIRYYLETIFFITNKSLNFADKIHDIKLQTSIKTSIMIGLPIIVFYTTSVIVYFTIIITILLLVLALVIFCILAILGGSPSGGSIGRGGGSSSGSGGGSSSSSSSAIFGSSYEETAKEESRPFKVDKETKSSEGALPFGLGGDTIYKTEYEDTSTGETVKGHGWTRSEADFNARKNLKNK